MKKKIKLKLKKTTISKLNDAQTIKGGGGSNFTGVEIITIGGGLGSVVSCGYIQQPDTSYEECDRES